MYKSAPIRCDIDINKYSYFFFKKKTKKNYQ